MSIFAMCRYPRSAPLARERLQILLADDRAAHHQPDLVAALREEIAAAIAKHINAAQPNVQIQIGRGPVPILAIEVEVPIACSRASAGGRAQSPERAS